MQEITKCPPPKQYLRLIEPNSPEFWQCKSLRFDKNESTEALLVSAIIEVFTLTGANISDLEFINLIAKKYAAEIMSSEIGALVNINQIKKCFQIGRENRVFKAYNGNIPSIQDFYEAIHIFNDWKLTHKPILPTQEVEGKKVPTRREIIGSYFELAKKLGANASDTENLIRYFILLESKEYTDILKPFWGIPDDELANIVASEVSITRERLIAETAPKEMTAIAIAMRKTRIEEINNYDDAKIEVIAKRMIARRQNLLVMLQYSHLTTDEFLTIIFNNQ